MAKADMASALPTEFMPVPVILVGHALFSLPLSLSGLIVTAMRPFEIVFNWI